LNNDKIALQIIQFIQYRNSEKMNPTCCHLRMYSTLGNRKAAFNCHFTSQTFRPGLPDGMFAFQKSKF
jgi:hypothetical protein